MSRLTIASLIHAASVLTGVAEPVIRGQSRQKRIVHIRWAVAVAAREQGYSSPQIGRALGDRDHSTILYAVQQSAYLAERRPDHGKLIANITRLASRQSARDRHHISVTFACFQEASV